MTAPSPRRNGGPYIAIASDVIRHALRHRSWLLLIVVLCAVLATILVVAGQSSLPYLIYPAL